MFIYDTETKIEKLVKSFEDATISRDDWHHAEHLIVALFYVSQFDMASAVEKMRAGILNLLVRGFNVDLNKEMPYHETLTVFWMRTANAYFRERSGEPLPNVAKSFVAEFDKDYPLRFYAHDVLFSDEARAKFIEPGR